MEKLHAKSVNAIASRYWAYALKKRMGGISFGKIQKCLSADYIQIDPNFWNSYSRWLYKISRGHTIKNQEFIQNIEDIAPGTKHLLTHPLWEILANPEATREELHEYMLQLDIGLITKLFKTDEKTKRRVRKRLDRVAHIYRIAMFNDMDSLACLLMLIREAEHAEMINAYIKCKWAVHHLLARLTLFSPFKEISDELIDLIYTHFLERNNPLPQSFSYFSQDSYLKTFSIPTKQSTLQLRDENTEILSMALAKQLISSKEEEQLAFIFWIDININRADLRIALHDSPAKSNSTNPTQKFPPLIEALMAMMKGDSRKYIPKDVLRF